MVAEGLTPPVGPYYTLSMPPSLHPDLIPEYEAAVARGLSESASKREAFVLTYQITDNAGAYRSREQVIKTVGAYLAPVVPRPYTVAREYVDNHTFMRRHVGETAGAIARDVWLDIPSERWAVGGQPPEERGTDRVVGWRMIGHVEWDDDALVLVVGSWRVWVAYVEEYGSPTDSPRHAQAFLYGWGTEVSDLDLNAGVEPRKDEQSGTLGVFCRSRAEATAAIRTLYALRGVEVPPAPWEAFT